MAREGRLADAYPMLHERGRPDLAGAFAESMEDFRQAAHWYEVDGDLRSAARMRIQAQEPLMAAALLERVGALGEAAELYEDSDEPLRASSLYEQGGDPRKAAQVLVAALESGSHAWSPEEVSEASRRAAYLFAELNEVEQGVRILRWGGEHRSAARLLARAGRHAEAIRLFEEVGDLLSAAEVARSAGDSRRHHELLGRRAEQEGELLQAAAHYEESGDTFSAIRVYELASQPDQAAAAAERGGLWDSAAQLYERLGRYGKAAECLRNMGRQAEAEAVLQRANSKDASIQSQAAQAQYFGAALSVLARARQGEQSRYREAVHYLQQVSADHPDYLAARTMLGEVLAEMGEVRQALAALQELFVGVAPDGRFVPAMYQYARLLEGQGYLAGARNAYRTVVSFDPRYRDVEERLRRLRETDRVEAGRRELPTPAGLPVVVAGPARTIPAPSETAANLMPALTQDLALPSDPTSPSSEPGRLQTPTPDLPPPAPMAGPTRSPRTRSRSDALVGVTLRDRFRMERRIGRGAQALVYLARDQVLDRRVAIKVLSNSVSTDDKALTRFLREARLAARVHHPNCVAIYDFGQERGLTFIAMEYFAGRTLRDVVRKGPLNPYLAFRIGRDVAAALGAVHEAGVVHRDVKPTNVMVDRTAQVRLTDFGVARTSTDDSSAGMMVGTMKYMAPEQARGKDTDLRADIFSFGVVMWEMLAGRPPFGGTLDDLISRVSKPPPVLPSDIAVPEPARDMVIRCMQRRPEHRYPSVEPLLDDINSTLSQLKRSRDA